MTHITYVSPKEMVRRTGLDTLGYARPDREEILIQKGLPKKLERVVKAHEFEHIKKGEEGPFWGALVGGALSAAGSLMGQPSGPPKYKPWDINLPGLGSVDFNRDTRTVTGSLDPQTQALMQRLYGQAMGPGYGQGMSQFGQSMVGLMPGLFQDAQNSSYLDPAILQNFNSQLGGVFNQQQGMMGGLYRQGQNMMNGLPGSGANRALGMGFNMLRERPTQDFQDMAQQRVDLLREQAAPFENRAQNSMFQKLQGMGQMGMPAGMRNMQSFATELGRADLGRQLAGQDLANTLRGQDMNYYLGRNQLGAGLVGQGMDSRLQSANMGANMMNYAMQGNRDLANMANMGYGNNMGFMDAINQRAQQRMGAATGLFGLGSDAQSRDLQQALASMAGYQGFQGGLSDMVQMGANMGAQASGAGAAYGPQSNPWGGILQGFGAGMMNSNWGGFGGAPGSGFYQSQPIYPGGGVPMLPQPVGGATVQPIPFNFSGG